MLKFDRDRIISLAIFGFGLFFGYLVGAATGWWALEGFIYVVAFLAMMIPTMHDDDAALDLMPVAFLIFIIAPALGVFLSSNVFPRLQFDHFGIVESFIKTNSFRFTEPLTKEGFFSYFSEFDDIIDMVVNFVPYTLSKGIISVFGGNAITGFVAAGIIFVCHWAAANTWRMTRS